ncbi:MAG: hypothetical protein ACJA2O_004234 [Candidatus Azotimanducaceae bacterium]|jgi:hypothetical protein
MTFSRYLRQTIFCVAIAMVLGGCIGSPFPAGAVAELYRWDDLESPVAVRVGLSTAGPNDYFDGDFSFFDLLQGQSVSNEELSAPWLLRACYEDVCYSAVLFADLFELNSEQIFSGYASLTAISTAMANQVRDLPASQVRTALDGLASQVLADGDTSKRCCTLRVSENPIDNYAFFLALDPTRRIADREKLVSIEFFFESQEIIAQQPNATINVLFGNPEKATEDLAVPDGFLFNGSQGVSIDVDVSSRISEDAYLLICSEFDTTIDGYDIDLGDCQLSTLLRNGSYSAELSLADSVEALVAVILPLENPNDASYEEWSRELDGAKFLIR